MANTDELIIKTFSWQYPEQIPVSIGFLPAAIKKNYEEIAALVEEHADLFGYSLRDYDYEKSLPASYHYGSFTDAWGCVWSNEQEGMESYVTGHPIPNREDILTLKAPAEDMGLPHGFMYLRLLDLRGFEEAMMDFAEECDELQMLIDIVRDYNIRQMKLVCEKSESKIVWAGDDLGMQIGLAVGAEKWRKYLKPAFKAIYDVAHACEKYVYMHTDGDIIEIMPDLMECGVDILNPQFRANGLDRLEATCKGKIPIMLDLDRQLFPFATPDELRAHVREAVERLYLPQGGLGLNVEIGMEVPMENVRALVEEVDRMRFYKG